MEKNSYNTVRGDTMIRNIYQDLKSWKRNPNRKPLLLFGARQVGKTYILSEFGKNEYRNLVYVNLERDSLIREVFELTLDPREIVKEIELFIGSKIDKSDTLLFIDEIQVSERAITSLKYFNEELNDLHVVAAGSLLGVVINRESVSFPVGKVELHKLYPMTFDEFLVALNEELLLETIRKSIEESNPLSRVAHEKGLKLYKEYLVIGGMPEMVQNFINSDSNLQSAEYTILDNILNSYKADMSKYTTASEALKVRSIYDSIPAQLVSDYKKFKYSVVKKGAKARDYQGSIEWLLMSNICIESIEVNRGETPLKAFADSKRFKLYMCDVGLLTRSANLSPLVVLKDEDYIFKGAITENYVAQHIKTMSELYYWKKNTYEVDFLIECGEDIIPIEVKSKENTRARSLKEYNRIYSGNKSVIFSQKNLLVKENVLYIPLYAVWAYLDYLK